MLYVNIILKRIVKKCGVNYNQPAENKVQWRFIS